MSLASACLWTLARTLVICLVAWPVCAAVERWLKGLSDGWRSVALIGLLAPFCFPELLVGYAFRDLALFHPRWAEWLCSCLLFVRVVPVGAVALLMAPPPECAAAAIHCRRMLSRGVSRDGQWLELARCYWHGPVSRALPALGLMGVVAFQEFELAALLMTTSWTDWFVAAERVGLERGEMLRQTVWPLLMQLPVLFGLIVWMRRDAARRRGDSPDETDLAPRRLPSHTVPWFAPAYMVLALIAGCVVPLCLIGWRTVDSPGLFARQRNQQLGLLREMAISLTVAVCAGLMAWTICWRMQRLNPRRPETSSAGLSNDEQGTEESRTRRAWTVWVLLVPGLLGSLLLSLGTVTVFQVSWLRPLYDTPLPWVLALTLWLLPRAAVMQLWLATTRPSEAVHLAEMLGGRRGEGGGAKGQTEEHGALLRPPPSALLWRLRDQPRFLAMSLLCYWAYGDLPTAYLLAPTGMASGLVRLYNQMHFGHYPDTSVQGCFFYGTPLVSVGIVLLVMRWWRG